MQIKANNYDSQTINVSVSSAADKSAKERTGKHATKEHKTSFFAGDLGFEGDMVALRRQRAQKKALKIVGDAWNGDRKIDRNILDIKSKINQLNVEREENLGYIAEGDAKKEALRKEYGVDPDSQEQKDLELIEKSRDAMYSTEVHLTKEERDRLEEINGRMPTAEDLELLKKREASKQPGSKIRLTAEEEEQLAQLDGIPLTEYQERCLQIDSHQRTYESRNDQIEREIMGYNGTIRGIRLERLKYHEMMNAQKKADKVMEEAGKEIVGMLVDEAKDHVDEELEEPREEAKEKAEEKEEQEEKIEENQERQEELEERIDSVREDGKEQERLRREAEERSRDDADLLESIMDAGMGNIGSVSDVQVEVKNMLHKMKLLEEDLKGSAIDDQV